MIQFTVHAAKTHLSKLIEAALAGEEVVIARGRKPAVRLIPVAASNFKLGILEGMAASIPDFLAPLSDAELADWEGN